MKKMALAGMAGLCLAWSAVAAAQAPSASADGTRLGPQTDPDQVVCITERPIGSRLGARRVCRTRAQWAEHNRIYRQEIERAQQQTQSSGQ